MLAGGALAFAFIPIYTEFLTGEEKPDSNTLVSQVINLVMLLVIAASLLAAIAAPMLVYRVVAPDFPAATQALTIQLMRILLLSTVLFAVSSILTATLYAHQHFVIPALLPSVYNFGIIVGTLLLAPRYGIYGVAWGAVLGAFLHLLAQVPMVLRYGVRWQPVLNFRDKALRKVAVLMAPRVVDLLMARITIELAGANLISGLGEGRLAAFRLGRTLMNMPWTLIGTAIGIAVFPTLAALAAKGDKEGHKQAINGAVRAVLTLAIPAAVGMLVLGRPIIRVLFEGGEFDARSTALTFYALQFFMVALISQSLLDVVVRSFASLKDTYTPLYISFFTTALNIGLAIWLTRPIAEGGISHGGPALANGIAVAVEATIGLVILSRRLNGINAGRIVVDALKALVAAGAMAGVILAFQQVADPSDLVLLVVGGVGGGLVYFAVALALGVREIKDIPSELLKRTFRRRAAA
jgi:putative peptidoglycan lipid II flippase